MCITRSRYLIGDTIQDLFISNFFERTDRSPSMFGSPFLFVNCHTKVKKYHSPQMCVNFFLSLFLSFPFPFSLSDNLYNPFRILLPWTLRLTKILCSLTDLLFFLKVSLLCYIDVHTFVFLTSPLLFTKSTRLRSCTFSTPNFLYFGLPIQPQYKTSGVYGLIP